MFPRSVQEGVPLHIPLKRLALCLDCEVCFDIGTERCPACDSATWVPLARFLERRAWVPSLTAA